MKQYTPELYLSGEQAVRFEKKIIEFLIREEKIKELKISDRDKLKTLTQLSVQETAQMGSIFDRRQLRRYVRLKKKIPPVVFSGWRDLIFSLKLQLKFH